MQRREIAIYKKNKSCSKLDISIEELDFIMQTSEDVDAICSSAQVINLNNYTITSLKKIVLKLLEKGILKPFVFVCSLN